ncbi:MAG: tandem-95 repeat protein, partial [Chloroflexi bacterium]|nr:tandem-95 repeat protein [Chloroflexota bacterium]
RLGLGDTNHRGDQSGEMGEALPAADLGTGRTATANASRNQHPCALLDNGQVKCWGYNYFGQLGLGDTSSRGDGPNEMGDALPAVDLGAGRTAVAIAAGGNHTCARLDTGAVKCWGYNWAGQLGLGNTSWRGDGPNEMGDALPAASLGGTVAAPGPLPPSSANQAPTADSQAVTTAEDMPVAITLTATDPESSPLTFAVVVSPAQGTLSGAAPNLTYTPNPNFHGTDHFSFRASDGSLESPIAAVTITVTSVNDVPVAAGRSVLTSRHAPVAIPQAASDADGDPLSVVLVVTPTHGTLGGVLPTLVYSPALDFTGVDVFAFRATDGSAESNLATVTVTVRTPLIAGLAGRLVVQAGGDHGCAVLEAGALKCWGSNSYGQLGLGDVSDRGDGPSEMGSALPAVDLGIGRTAASVSAGGGHTCALLDTDQVKCWGFSQFGRLGLGDTIDRGDAAGEMGDALPAVDLGAGRTAVAIATGVNNAWSHTCAILDTGQVKCWGHNADGELGLGDRNNRGWAPGEMGDALPAVNLGTGRTAAAIATGGFHTCALLDTGEVKCWGFSDQGQLGLGDKLSRGDEPGEMGDALPAVDLGAGRTATAVAAGSSYTCAILDTGQVKCWGRNYYGQLGLGDKADRGDQAGEMGDALPAIDLGAGRTAVVIAPGGKHTCALLDDGNVKCWGYNSSGQLGLGDQNDRGDGPGEMGGALPAVNLGTGRTALAVDAGVDFTCALLDTNQIKCWGYNGNGRLGLGDVNARGDGATEMGDNLPVVDLAGAVLLPTANRAPVANSQSVSTPEDTAVAITLAATDADGDTLTYTVIGGPAHGALGGTAPNLIYTPAANFNGADSFTFQASDGVTNSNVATVTIGVTPVNDPPVAFSQSVSTTAGTAVTITLSAADADGDALTYTVVTAPGHGTLSGAAPSLTYSPAAGFAGVDTFTFVASDGNLESNTATVTVTVAAPPAPGGPARSVVQAGSSHTCALLETGEVKCWGGNNGGQLGLGDKFSRGDAAGEMGAALPAVNLGTGRTAASIAVGGGHSCALLDTGQVKCWGWNGRGDLGLWDTNWRGDGPGEMGDALPTVDLGIGRLAVALSAGGYDTCALLDNGQVKCWGSNDSGQLGLGDVITRGDNLGEMGDALPAVDLGAGRRATAIAAGTTHTCALLDNGQVKCWGDNFYGQLGLGDTIRRGDNAGEMGDALPAVNLGAGRTATAIAVGNSHTCAVLDTGQVKCWGSNSWGELGLGNYAGRGDGPGEMGDALPAVNLGAGRTATALAAGYSHTCALLDNGQIKCWGGNTFGQLGLGNTTNRGGGAGDMGDSLPAVDLGAGRTALAMTAGDWHTCALLDNGQIKCWGRNHLGQDGLGDTLSRGDGPGEMGDALPVVDLAGAAALPGPVPPAPANQAPIAGALSVTTAEDTPVAVTLAAADPDGDPVTFIVVVAPAQGTLSGAAPNLTYTPKPNFFGADAFYYRATDGSLESNVVAVAITVTPVADAPVADDRWLMTSKNAPVAATLLARDADGEPLTYTVVTPPAHGTLSGVAPSLVYSPALDFTGVDTFTFRANAGGEDTNLATVTVTVRTPLAPGIGGHTVLAVAGWAFSTCALLDTGEIKCWGQNTYGQLGLGDVITRGDSLDDMGSALPAVDLGAGRTGTGVALGNQHACAVLDTGQIKCWGDNFGGGLGQGDTVRRGDGPGEMGDTLPAVDLGIGRTALATTAGAASTCALLDTGQVKCWGANGFGGLGQGDTVRRGDGAGEMGDALPAVDLGIGRTAVAIDTLNYQVCALLDTGQVKCWGYNITGGLGQGDSSNRGDGPGEMGDALPPVDLGTGRTAVGITVGSGHACALLENGPVKCWGSNYDGRLGLGDMSHRGNGPGEMGDALPAVNLGTGRTAVAVAAGYDHTCAILDGGQVKCWGRNTYGQLGLGDVITRGDTLDNMGDALPAVDLGTGRTAIAIAAGISQTCVVLDNRRIKCWGRNHLGQLGLGDLTNRGDGPGEMGDALPYVELAGLAAWPVVPTNQAPIASSQSVTTTEDTAVAIILAATDPDGSSLTFAVLNAPTHGTLSGTAPNLTYTPDPNFHGADAFTFRVSDGVTNSTVATVAIAVTPVNDPPVAADDTATTVAGQAVSIAVLANDADADGDALRVVTATQGTNGTVVANPNGTVTYTPNAGFSGTDSFTYTATDDHGGTDTATVAVTVRAPVAGNEVRDVRQSNVTDVSFTLSFLSRFPAIASVAYWISGTLPMTPTLAADFRTAPGETHWVRVGGSSVANRLLPETTYRYAIALDGQPMADGWVRTGRTLGERGSDGVFGRVVDRWGNPVPGAIVYLDLENLAEVISGTATHPTSALLSDVTQGDGYWWIDLGGARTRDLMARFAYAESDLVHLEAFGQADGFGYADLPVGVLRSAPLDIQLRPVVGRPVHLGVGWNAVGLPLEPTRPISVSQLARAVNRDGARLTAAFRYTAGAWQGVAVDGTGLVNPQADFPLKPGEGYFLKLREPFTWELVGHEVTQATPLRLALGWNLVGVPQADDAWQPDGLRASNLSDATGIISGTQQTYHVGEVDRWIYGSYEGHVAPHPFNNFRIEGTRSYFLKANRAGTLIPGESGYGLPPE